MIMVGSACRGGEARGGVQPVDRRIAAGDQPFFANGNETIEIAAGMIRSDLREHVVIGDRVGARRIELYVACPEEMPLKHIGAYSVAAGAGTRAQRFRDRLPSDQ